MKKGRFIVIDGNDGSGKQTQATLLAQHLKKQGKKVALLSFPRYTETFFGRFLKDLLQGRHGDFIHLDPYIASLPYAADRSTSAPEIKKILDKGGYVISDRYTSANQIHQGGKIQNPTARKKFLNWLDTMEHDVLGVVRPDVIVYLDVPVQVSLQLLQNKQKDTVEENEQYLKNSVISARNLMKDNPKTWVHVTCVKGDTMRTREDIHAEIVSLLKL